VRTRSDTLMRFVLLLCTAYLSVLWVPPAFAQDAYPMRPVRLLVPFPAGGAADLAARTIGERIAAQMGQSVVIDNRPGAGGRLATEMLARAEADGYTLMAGVSGAITISPSLYQKLPYDPARDLLPITRLAEIINVMVVNPGTGANTVREFITWARSRDSGVRYGSSGVGQPDHLSGELFERLTGVRLMHVPYKGGGPALVDLVAGDLQVMFPTYIVALPHLKAGRLRILAVTTPQRQTLLPDLPTVGEDVTGFSVSNWTGLFAPAKTPQSVADKLLAEVNKAVENPEVRKRLRAGGLEPEASASTKAFAAFLQEETVRWAKVIREANIKAE
jgi:tripartite-type tricarboxylate transporter receptor subunit TctC